MRDDSSEVPPSAAPAGPPPSPAACPGPAAASAGPGTGEVLDAGEVLDVVDEEDRVVGRSARGEAYARRLRTRCTFVLVQDGEGRVFVHRRTDRKLVFPSHYDMFVGGVVGAGEGYDEAALREAEEELGVAGLPQPEFLFKFLYDTPEHTWWSAVYRVRCELRVNPQPEEVAWHAFLTREELAARLEQWPWVPDGLAAWQRLVESRGAPA
ncbi:NUDIX domain-containing protein [Streptomyces sp. NPDC059740]|uniref:NUDIX domain-containing protein n=1 Tax=Streptomyces sp. NPDC059740 TaxID=3346926 RepID=UPI00366A09FA